MQLTCDRVRLLVEECGKRHAAPIIIVAGLSLIGCLWALGGLSALFALLILGGLFALALLWAVGAELELQTQRRESRAWFEAYCAERDKRLEYEIEDMLETRWRHDD